MSKNRFSPFLVSGFICALITGVIYLFLQYVEFEGFNPSDDGVILAQSFRIFNGEIPHKDFISIRPVFSGILHGIHLFSPLPLQISARWFIIFQYFAYSFIWVYLIFRVYKFKFPSTFLKILCFTALAYFSFLLSNIYNLYPWTTVDAIFISIIGIWIFNKMFKPGLSSFKQSIFCAAGLFLFSLAGVTRQSFIIIAFLFFILVFIFYLKRKKYASLLWILLLGSLPITIYLFFLFYHNAFTLFIDQMTGRTELFQTGIKQFANSFINSWLLPIHIIALLGILYIKMKNKWLIKVSENGFILRKQMAIVISFRILYILATFFISIFLFIRPELLFKCAFELFWINLIFTLAIILIIKPSKEITIMIVFSLLLAWTSAISLGDNSPVFTTGILAANIIGLFFFINQQTEGVFKLRFSTKLYYAIIPGIILFFLLALFGQRKSNYRDLPSSQLNKELFSTNSDFGRIKTNINTYKYFVELNYVIDQLGGLNSIRDHVVVVPNNSIFYPLYNSKNPFPLDWLQREEYIGSGEFLHSKIKEVLSKNEIYIIIDKFDSKKIARGFFEIEISGEKYNYIDIIKEKCEKINVNSELFFVLKSKHQ